MTQQEMIADMVEELFQNMGYFAYFQVWVKRADAKAKNHNKPVIRGYSMPGVETCEDWFSLVNDIALESEKEMMNRFYDLDHEAQLLFLERALKKTDELLDTVELVWPEETLPDGTVQEAIRMFKQIPLTYEDRPDDTEYGDDSLKKQLIPFANTWYTIAKSFQAHFRVLDVLFKALYGETLLLSAEHSPSQGIKATVSECGLLLRLFYDKELFNYETEAELIKLYCNMFSVASQEGLSWEGIQNHEEITDPDDPEYWENMLTDLQDSLYGLWGGNLMN